jgi:gas vesicle protein
LQEVKPYLTEAEVKAKEYKEIVRELAEERKETAKMYSQEVKEAYYEAKAFALEQAELETLKGKLSELGKQAVNITNDAYVTLVEQLESTRYNLLVKEDGVYQKALTAFYKAKADYVNYRNYVAGLEESEATTAILERLDSLKSIVDRAETALLNAKESANNTIDGIKESLTKAHKTVINAIETFSVKASDYLTEISAAKKDAIEKFTADFENEYKEINARIIQRQEELRKEFTKEVE